MMSSIHVDASGNFEKISTCIDTDEDFKNFGQIWGNSAVTDQTDPLLLVAASIGGITYK